MKVAEKKSPPKDQDELFIFRKRPWWHWAVIIGSGVFMMLLVWWMGMAIQPQAVLYPFTVKEGVIEYKPAAYRTLARLADRQTAETSPEAAMEAASSAGCGGDGDWWAFVEGMEEVLRRVRLDMVLEYGNAIPPAAFVRRAQEVLCRFPCLRKVRASDEDFGGRIAQMARQWEKGGLTWSQAAWRYFTTPGSIGVREFGEIKGAPDLKCP